MQYIIYSILERSDIQNIGPVVGVLGCDIALGPLTGPIFCISDRSSILYNIHTYIYKHITVVSVSG